MVDNRGLPSYQGHLNERCITIAQALASAGYRSYAVGKWHVTPMTEALRHNWPLQRGFERFYGTAAGGNYFAPSTLMRDNQKIEPEKEYYVTDAFSENAVRLVEEHGKSERPFFLYLAYTAPHWPLQAWPEDIAKYKGKFGHGWDIERERRHRRMIELGILDDRFSLSPRDPRAQAWDDSKEKEEWDLRMAVFAAQIDRMDQGIGKVLEAVRTIDAAENTLVLFLSDNGASAEKVDRGHQPGAVAGTKESFKCPEVAWSNTSNTPFRWHKKWVHEGGIATPLIAYWPGVIQEKGTVTHQSGMLSISWLPVWTQRVWTILKTIKGGN